MSGRRPTDKELWLADAEVLAEAYPPNEASDDLFDYSRVEYNLHRRLAKLTGCNPVQMDRLYRESELYREEWERKGYRERTIGKAITHHRSGPDPSIIFAERGRLPPGASATPLDSVTAGGDPFARAMAITGEARFQLEKFRDIRASRKSRALVEDVLGRETLAAIIGSPGCSKTFLALDLAFAIARGTPWFGHSVRKVGRVIYVAAEGGDGVRARIEAYSRKHGLETEDVELFLLSEPVSLMKDGNEVEDLIRAIRMLGNREGPVCDAIFIDTLSMSIPGGDENSSTDMTMVVDSAKRMIRELETTVVLIHHLGKEEKRGARGHSSLHAALDTELSVEKASSGFQVKMTKQRDLELGAAQHYSLESVIVAHDEHKKPITSCTVVPSEAPLLQSANKLTPTGQELYDCFMAVLGKHGMAIPTKIVEEHYGEESDAQKGVWGVQYHLVKDRFLKARQEHPDKSDNKPDSARTAFDRGKRELKKLDFVDFFGGYMWAPNVTAKARMSAVSDEMSE